MGFYEQLRGLMCQNRGLLNKREQSKGGENFKQWQLIFCFIVEFHKETGAWREFVCAVVACVFDCRLDIPSAARLPSCSNLVQYSPRRAEARAVSDIDFTKHFQDGLLAAFLLPCIHFLFISSRSLTCNHNVQRLLVIRIVIVTSRHLHQEVADQSPTFRISDTYCQNIYTRAAQTLTANLSN